jgi:hypothetical protein
MMTTEQKDGEFSGIWYCGYSYPSNQHKGEDISEYYAVIHQRGSKLVLQSLPNQEGSTLTLKMTVDGDLASGYWEEGTSPTGEFGGAIYSGVVQLLISKDNKRMTGKWVGIGQDNGKRGIYNGEWTMHRAGAKEAAAATDQAS